MIEPSGRVILPGGAGLVGQNLVPRLLSAGYRDIVVIDKHESNLQLLKQLHPEVTCIAEDLAEPNLSQSYYSGAGAVIMLQAQIGGLREADFWRNNILATQEILRLMSEHEIPRLIHVSSSVVNSAASDLYSNSKSQQEQLVLATRPDAVVLRPTLMFGWFDRKHLGWLARFMQRLPVFPIPGRGRFMRQPLYAGDFAAIITSALQSSETRGVFDISGLERIDYIDLIREVRRASGHRSAIVPIPFSLFYGLLWLWSRFDSDPPFTTQQLIALATPDEFPVIDWPGIFKISPTPLAEALNETFQHPVFSKVLLEF